MSLQKPYRKKVNKMNKILIIHKLIYEVEELSDKILKLEEFMVSDSFNNITAIQQHLLEEQYDIMRDYLTVLLRRIYNMNEGN